MLITTGRATCTTATVYPTPAPRLLSCQNKNLFRSISFYTIIYNSVPFYSYIFFSYSSQSIVEPLRGNSVRPADDPVCARGGRATHTGQGVRQVAGQLNRQITLNYILASEFDNLRVYSIHGPHQTTCWPVSLTSFGSAQYPDRTKLYAGQ